MASCQVYTRLEAHAFTSPALSFRSTSTMSDWGQQQYGRHSAQLPSQGYYTHPDMTQQAQYQYAMPPEHVLGYFSPPQPQSPYTPQSMHSPSPTTPQSDGYASSYTSSRHAAYPEQLQYHLSQRHAARPPQSQPARASGRAVVIGINYFNQKGEMKGRTDEARNLSNYLKQVKHYSSSSIILLTDDQNGPFSQPTKKNILSALHWLGEKAYPGEKLVLYYSGHGKVDAVGKKKSSSKRHAVEQAPSTETIYPVDFRSFKEGMIKPEELEELLEPVRRKGAKLTLIMDAHAGIAGKGKSPASR